MGIKVHRHDARITREVCEAARRFRLPVLYDIVGEAAVLELLAEQYPDVDFIIPHLGSFADDWSAQLAVIDHLVRHPNMHADSLACAGSICWNRPCAVPARGSCCSVPTVHGCTRQRSWPNRGCSNCRPMRKRWCSAGISCG